jgi:hypothetical protein
VRSGSTVFKCALALATLLCHAGGSTVASADKLERKRREGLEEVRFFLNKDVQLEATLVSKAGPDEIYSFLGIQLEGCPAAPTSEIPDQLSTQFRIGGAGAWVGDLDGVNARITKATGSPGSGFAVFSAGRAPEFPGGPEFQFSFDGSFNVRRALIDSALERLEACVKRLPPGRYPGDELQRLCPSEEFSREQVGQTCVPYMEGTIGDPLPDGTGYKVFVNQGTKCDFVANRGKGSPSTSFTACYNGFYEGVARLSSPQGTTSALKRAAATAKRTCKKVRAKASRRALNACAAKAMSQSMDSRTR